MRIGIDMQACQTESRHRGIGRYSMELTRALLSGSRDAEEFLLGLDRTLAEHIPAIRAELGTAMSKAHVFGYTYPQPLLAHGSPGDGVRAAAAAMIRQQYSEYSPDVVHVSSLFEDAVDPIGPLGRLARLPGTISSVTLYDLIPAVFPEQYLVNNERRGWYEARLQDLQQFDVVLSISEATKNDAIRLLGIPEERIAVIHAGVDERFFRVPAAYDPQAIKKRFGIEDRFVLYTGNSDPRKNLSGAIEAFAAIPRQQRHNVQLVMNQVGDVRAVQALAHKAGLAPRDLVITGRVDDDALNVLLRSCDVFFFPSLYEGFGLPVLEAMACGAVAIAADNSSLREVVASRDALFDPGSIDGTVRALIGALDDEGFRARLREQGVARAREYTWERSARLAREAWSSARERRVTAPANMGRRPTVALVTPLPPERTGIADYIAELLPALGERMVIDVYTTAEDAIGTTVPGARTVRPWSELQDRAGLYDQVVYQVGNSPFHAHMVDLVDLVPGLVVLHDFFLSSMMDYVDLGTGQLPGLFSNELERSHGVGALAVLDRQGRAEAVEAFPCSRRLIERADAVLVHSEHAVEMAQAFFPGLLRGPLVRAPMPIEPRSLPSAPEREQLRTDLGIAQDDILVTSFGFLAETKLNLETLAAFADPRLATNPKIRLIFVGDIGGGDYSDRIKAAIAVHPMRERIHVTGFVTSRDYERYLLASDISVQLRQLSRGETSKAVFDCMSKSVPVLVNRYGSFAEIPDDAAPKVLAKPEIDDLVRMLQSWVEDSELRREQGERGRHYVERAHAPEHVAAVYRNAVELSIESRMERTGTGLAKHVGASLASASNNCPADLRPIQLSLEAVNLPSRMRLFVDASELASVDYGTGIHRVVRNVLRELALNEDGDHRCIPTLIAPDGSVSVAQGLLTDKLGLRTALPLDSYTPATGDVLFLLDSNWSQPERFGPAIASMREAGGQVIGMVYDLIPILHPQHCVEFMPQVFETWLRYVVANCDGLICISKAVANELRAWIERADVPHRMGLSIGHVWLGSDVAEASGTAPTSAPSAQVVQAMGTGEATVLMVGTVEPRKRHDLALDAFERLWAEGGSQRLVIVGKKGWNVEALCARILGHSEFGKRLFWLQGLSDTDLTYAYEHAGRILQASDAEGFGLPIVEASRYGKPLLLSDLAVFREIAGTGADYFTPGDVRSLHAQLRSNIAPTEARAIPTLTWRECAHRLVELMKGNPWDHQLQ